MSLIREAAKAGEAATKRHRRQKSFCTLEIFGRAKLPSLAKEGWLRPSTKCRAASSAGADGVVGSSHRLSVVDRTTPAAPSKEGNHFFDGASFLYASPYRARAPRPPWPRRGVIMAQKRNMERRKFLKGGMLAGAAAIV